MVDTSPTPTRSTVRFDRRAVLAVVVVVATTAYLFAPLWVGALTGEPRFFEWDVPEEYWPDLVYLCRSLHRGELPLWNPFDRGGYPYYADPQAGTYHPLNWGICAVAGSEPGLAWAELRVVLGFLFSGLFSLLWLRRIRVSWAAATLGAVVIECAPFMRHNWELNLTAAMGFLPLVLWALEGVLQQRRFRDAALLAMAQSLLVWTGSPPVIWFGGTFTAIYALGRCIELYRQEPDSWRAMWKSMAACLGIAALLTAGLCAVVLIPGLTLASYSVQAGRSFDSIAEGGLDLPGMTAFLWPRDGNHLYVGWVALLLAPWALVRGRLPGRWALAGASLLALLLVMGEHAPFFGWAFDIVPGVHLFRLPHRYEAWLGPALGALAAGGLDEVLVWCRSRWPHLETPRVRWVVGLGLPVVLSLVVVFDVTRRMPEDRHTRAGRAPDSVAHAERVLSFAPHRGYRVMDEFGISCRSGTRLERRELRGYQDPLLLHSFERMIASLRDHPGLAPQFNVRYALTGPHFIHGWDRHFLAPPAALLALDGAVDRSAGVIEFRHALPMAYVVDARAVEHVTRREEALSRTIELAPAPIAILEMDAPHEPAPTEQPLTPARVVGYGSDRLAIEATADHPSVLVINETWYPGWVGHVDGDEVPIVRANGLVRALAMPAGTHRIEMVFEPADGMPLRWLWLASWVLVLALLLAPARRRESVG